MDYNNDNEHWNWRRNNQLTQKDSNHDMSECMWKGVPQNEEDISYMFDDETTPVKACGDLAYHVNFRDDRSKEPEPEEQSFSQIKRRRMLQFDTQDLDPSLSCDELSSSFLNTNERLDSIEEAFSEASQWVSGFAGNSSSSCFEGLDQSPDEWIAECFNNTDMHFSPDELNFAGASDVQLDITKLCDLRPEHEVNVVQQRITRTPQNVIFKGRKSYIRTPTKLATSVAYPFAFIKPSGAHGDVTLKDINQRIRTPPPSKAKQKQEEPAAYPTSAFSGKPVVGKTKIRTEGGKGSITIMRTKG
ncbi:hypothetical protein ACFX15_034828 [Malus domestica]|uniref:protein XRI1 isoform X1 n=1 Tax=Malus domestica TaxID=3750 RepID=UPI0010A9CAA2|nr:protein XRI1 isoform X2 [Malus domestica]XP_050146688.1 protein XRI1-like isoform X2 [Malus sylvestris]